MKSVNQTVHSAVDYPNWIFTNGIRASIRSLRSVIKVFTHPFPSLLRLAAFTPQPDDYFRDEGVGLGDDLLTEKVLAVDRGTKHKQVCHQKRNGTQTEVTAARLERR